MGLDWNIHRNGEKLKVPLPCNGMTLDTYLDGTTAYMVRELGLNPYYPLWPAEMTPAAGFIPTKTNIDAEDMRVIARLIAQRAECAEHLRIAAWLHSWAEFSSKENRISLYLSY